MGESYALIVIVGSDHASITAALLWVMLSALVSPHHCVMTIL